MRIFFILILALVAFILVVPNLIADVDLTTLIIVPTVSNSETLWVAMVSTTTQPSIQAMSPVFNIDP